MSIHLPQFHLPIHAIVEITHEVTKKVDEGIHRVNLGSKGFKLASGYAAFRHYDWLHNLPRFMLPGIFEVWFLVKN